MLRRPKVQLAIKIIILLVVVFFFPARADADAIPFEDNFNSYTLDPIAPQSATWTAVVGTHNIVAEDCLEGKCVYLNGELLGQAGSATTSEWSFYLRNNVGAVQGSMSIRNPNYKVLTFIAPYTTTTWRFRGYLNEWQILTTEFATGTWGFIKCKWDLSAGAVEDRWFNCVFGENTAYDPATQMRPLNPDCDSIGQMLFDGLPGGTLVDFIGDRPVPTQPPSLVATYPETATSTETAYGSFFAEGIYSYTQPAWDSLEIQLATSTTSTIYKFSVNIADDLSAPYSIPVRLPFAGTYNVSYVFFDYVTVFTEDFYWEDVFYYQVPIATTTITVGEGVSPDWFEWVEIETFLDEEPEGVLEHIVWSIQKFFIGIILPSQEAKTNFSNIVLKIRDKFPYSYIEEIQDFFTTSSANIEQDPSIEFAILGATGTAHTSFFDGNITIGSETKALFDWFKTISTLILWAGFLLYAVGFIRRIF